MLPARLWPKGAVPPWHRAAPVKLRAARPARQVLRPLASPRLPEVPEFRPATSHLLPALGSADKIVYGNADGTRTAVLYGSPVNYRQPGGAWAAIDTTLVPGQTAASSAQSQAAAGGWREKAAAFPASFAAFADAPALVRLPLPGGHWLGFGVAGASHVAGVAAGDQVAYPGAMPDADVRYIGLSGGVREQLVLRSRAAPASWVFPLTLSGVSAEIGGGGAIDFADAAGRVVAEVPSGFMTDSAGDPRTGGGAYSGGVSYALISSHGRPAIRMTLDESWLDSRARVYPVTVDPSVTVKSEDSNGTTYVVQGAPGDNSTATEIQVGTSNGAGPDERSFLKFDNVHSDLTNDNVLGAELGLFNTDSYSCKPSLLSVYPVTSAWTVTGSKTWPGPSIGSSIGQRTFANGYFAPGATTTNCPSKWHNIPFNAAGTALINGWTHTAANNGLALGASSSDNNGWKKFTSDSNPGTPAGQNPPGDPFLAVTYTTDGASYQLASTRPVTQVTSVQNGVIAVQVTNTGSSTWTPTNGYEMSYTAKGPSGTKAVDSPVFTAMPSTVAPGASVKVNVKVNKLPVGDYTFSFGMYSGATGASPVSFASEFVPPMAVGLVVADPAPVVTGIYPPSGTISPTVTPQLSAASYVPGGNGTPEYQFTVTCDPLPGTTCTATGYGNVKSTKPYWTVTPPLQWNEPYTWTVVITDGTTSIPPISGTITPEVPQPDVTSQIGGAGGRAGLRSADR